MVKSFEERVFAQISLTYRLNSIFPVSTLGRKIEDFFCPTLLPTGFNGVDLFMTYLFHSFHENRPV